MNFKYLYDQYTGLYSGIVRSPFPENSTDVEPYFNFACKTVWDFQKCEWKLVERFSFYEQFKDIDRVNELDVRSLKAIDEFESGLFEVMKDFRILNEEILKSSIFNNEKIIDNNTKIIQFYRTIRDDLDLINHMQQTELKFIKSQLHYLTTIIERPSLFQRFLKWIVFWR